jgi:hypothetical protein
MSKRISFNLVPTFIPPVEDDLLYESDESSIQLEHVTEEDTDG